MKLLYVSTLDHIIHVMLPHLDAARARGWQVDVACRVTRDPQITLAHCDALHDIPFARNPLDPRNLLATAKLVKLIRREKFDIVHCHNPSGGFYGRLAATMAGTKPLRVYTAHGFHFHPLGGKLSNFVYRTVEGFAGKYLSDAVLTINQWDFDEAKKLMPPEKVYFTRGVGVSTDEFDPAKVSEAERQKIRNEFGVPEGGFLVTCIGEMIPRKGHEGIIRTWFEIFGREHTSFQNSSFDPKPDANGVGGKSDVILAFIGNGKLSEYLRACADEPKLQPLKITAVTPEGIMVPATGWKLLSPGQIIFPGFRRDVPAILAASDLFVFPSFQEGLPCAVQEALSMEVPVVAYDVRGCNDMIDDTCGRLVPLGDTAALGRAVAELLALPDETRREMGRAGRAKMIELYDRPKCVTAWLAIYDELLARKSAVAGGVE